MQQKIQNSLCVALHTILESLDLYLFFVLIFISAVCSRPIIVLVRSIDSIFGCVI